MSTLRLPRGDTGNWDFTCLDIDGEPMDFTGADCHFGIIDDEDVELVGKDLADGLSDAGQGVLSLTVLPADTAGMDPRTYHWGLRVEYDADNIFTIDSGLFILMDDAVAAQGS